MANANIAGAKGNMRILVDADACPVKQEIIERSKQFNVAVIFFVTLSHHFEVEDSVGIEMRLLDQEAEAVDIAIANEVTAEDLVVTQDYGLALLVLGKGGYALSPRGKIYKPSNMAELLAARHVGQKWRRAGLKTKGPRSLKPQDKHRFLKALDSLLRKVIKEKRINQ